MKTLQVKGAKLHNLKNIDIEIPKNKLTVATGVSGSGKSSLMFDIIFEEGRRQYLKSLGILTGLDDDVKYESIKGIGPTIAVKQSTVRQSNPRSTVGSRTGMLNLLSLLFAREGQPIGDDDYEPLPVTYFSHNHPNGMCFKCSGHGYNYEFDMDKLLPDESTSLKDIFDSIHLSSGFVRLVERLFGDYMDTAFVDLPDEVKADVLYGHQTSGNAEQRSFCLSRFYNGVIRKEGRDPSGVYYKVTCSECHGYKVGEDARSVYLLGRHIGEIGLMTITELQKHIGKISNEVTLSPMGKILVKEIGIKIDGMIRAKLGHLTLYRTMPSLSGGEMQRVFLNDHLESELDSLIYVLDEPTVGLHEEEKLGLIKAIRQLQEAGNTVLVVEHDKKVIEMADHVIDIGPGAGTKGGHIIYEGNYEGLKDCDDSVTGGYLSGKIPMPSSSRSISDKEVLKLKSLGLSGITTNNLKNISVSLPLGILVGVAGGVSGSGKSSLISDTLIGALRSHFIGSTESRSGHNHLTGYEHIAGGYSEVTQAPPIGRNANSNPATYIGIWDKIRKLFANQPSAQEIAYTAGHFSFNSKGACQVCGGKGYESVWLGGNLNIETTCSECHGKRYNDESLSITYKDKNIYQVLEMSVTEAITFFLRARRILLEFFRYLIE